MNISKLLVGCVGLAVAQLSLGEEAVWHAGHAEEMNEQLVFSGEFVCANGAKAVLRLASSNPYRVRLNGEFAWYGPARGPKGFFRRDEVVLTPKAGVNRLEIENAGSNCNSFYFTDQPSFLLAALTVDGQTVLETRADGGTGAFVARRQSARLRRVNRYSYQRMFAEAYRLPAEEGEALPLEARPPVKLLPRHTAKVDFSLKDDFAVLARGTFAVDSSSPRRGHWGNGLVGNPAANYKGYTLKELEYDTWDVATRVRPNPGQPVAPSRTLPVKANEYVLFNSPGNRTGFFGLHVVCREPGELHLFFDEILTTNGLLDVARNGTANTVAWRFDKPGVYDVEAFEPYTAKFAEAVALSGSFEVAPPTLRLYRSAESEGASLESSDARLERIFAAAEETYAQNAVDLFTDCPSRERAGWNCDSFFTGRTAALLTGNTEMERQYLENYALPSSFPKLPKGMFPMCYPADFADGNFIPSWAMFLTLELDEYKRLRNGDARLVEMFRPKIFALVDYLKTFRNGDGLLEKLPRWVFVEWSHANKLVQDVNYPNNMVWAATLDAVDRLYVRPDLAAEARHVRDEIRRQSWTGEWFCDNAVRQKDGSLKLSGECTETCQYYALSFGVATKDRYPELYRRMRDEFGPNREKKGLYPKIWPSNAFIGNYLRLEWLSREGCREQIENELVGYFDAMAVRTGTLWEMMQQTASCCHGFASHVAVSIVRDIMGVRRIDAAAKKVDFACPAKTGPETCVVTLPTSDGPLSLGWRKAPDGSRQTVCELPKGWSLSTRLYPTDVNVRDFGAKGDGVTDDTAALQAAADYAQECAAKMQRGVAGRHCQRNAQTDGPMPRVVLPEGTYCVSSPVFFCRNQQIYGFGTVTIKALSDDIDVLVFNGTLRQFVSGLTVEGGARQFLVETYNNESANFTVRDCTFRRARVTAIDSHSWQLPKNENRKSLVRVGTYVKDKATGRWQKDPRRDSPELRGYNNSTLITVDRCRFEDCQVAVDVNPDGAVFRDLTVTTAVSTGCVFRVANNLHAYGLDVTVRRPRGADRLAFIDYTGAHGFLLEHSKFRSADGKGVALVRNCAKKATYVSNTLVIRAVEVACGGCPEDGIVVCDDRKPVEFISLTDVTDTTGRKVKAIAFPDGISLADYEAFRRFQLPCDITYSIILGRNSANIDATLPEAAARYLRKGLLAPEAVPPLKSPRLGTSGEILWGPDYGVGLAPGKGDTEAMRRLFAVAATKRGVTVMLPPRRIALTNTVEIAGSVHVTSPGVAMVETADDAVTLFRVADGASVAFSHIFFEGGLHQVVCSAEKGATILLDSCFSMDSEEAAFQISTRGRPDALRFRLDGGVHYHPVWYEGNAKAILSGAWLRILPPKPYPTPFHESCAVVNRGKMRYQDILGVPCVFTWYRMGEQDKAVTPGDYRWIDNRGGELHSLFSRFGGEWGGIPPVYDYDGGKVLIEGSYAYFYPRYTAHQPIITDGKPADLRLFGMSCGFEVYLWYGGLKFMRRTGEGLLEPIPNARVEGNVPALANRKD